MRIKHLVIEGVLATIGTIFDKATFLNQLGHRVTLRTRIMSRHITNAAHILHF